MEVKATYDLAYDGVSYTTELNTESPKEVSTFVLNHIKSSKKISSRNYDINTNTYKNLVSNKNSNIIKFYNKFEEYALAKDEKIIRNYMQKGVTFRYVNRIMEAIIKTDTLTLVFLKDVKFYDIKKKLYMRKGYENQALCYCFDIRDNDDYDYALYLFDKLYSIITVPSENSRISLLSKEMSREIRKIDKNVKMKKVNKGLMFSSSRNFAILEMRKHKIHIRLLPVNDSDEILGQVGRGSYDPLSKYFDLTRNEDIKVIIPYLKKAYELTKYPAKDITSGLISVD